MLRVTGGGNGFPHYRKIQIPYCYWGWDLSIFFFFLLNYFCDSLYLFTLFNLERSKIIGLSLIVREFLDYFSLRQVNFHSKQMMASQVIPVNGLVT